MFAVKASCREKVHVADISIVRSGNVTIEKITPLTLCNGSLLVKDHTKIAHKVDVEEKSQTGLKRGVVFDEGLTEEMFLKPVLKGT